MAKNKSEKNINYGILGANVRIVNKDEFGIPNDVVSKKEALQYANENETDLVEISYVENNDTSICKLINYDKFLYQEKKKLKEHKQSKTELKEIRLTPNIGKADLETKKKQITKFLDEGNPVKIGIFFRGRELELRKDDGEIMLLQIANDFSEIAKINGMPRLEGKRMILTLTPKKK